MLDIGSEWIAMHTYSDDETRLEDNAKSADILVVGDSTEFLFVTVSNEMKRRGYTVKHAEPTVDGVNTACANAKAYLLVIDTADKVRDLLIYLKDVAFDRKVLVGLVGEKGDVKEAAKRLGSENVTRTFTRPIDAKSISDGLEEMIKESEQRNEKKKILVIDDNPEFLRRVQNVLHKQYKVYIANSGASGLMLLTKHKVDLILLDYMMPVLDGPKTLEALKSEPETQDIPVMFLTGKTDSEAVVKDMTLGANNYLAKSLAATDLAAMISDFFSKSDWKAMSAG